MVKTISKDYLRWHHVKFLDRVVISSEKNWRLQLNVLINSTILLKTIRAYWSKRWVVNLQFFSELITTQLRNAHGITANSIYLHVSCMFIYQFYFFVVSFLGSVSLLLCHAPLLLMPLDPPLIINQSFSGKILSEVLTDYYRVFVLWTLFPLSTTHTVENVVHVLLATAPVINHFQQFVLETKMKLSLLTTFC